MDNIGLPPLLARRILNILVFVNTASPFKPELDELRKYPLYGDLIHYFRDPVKQSEPADEKDADRKGENFSELRPGDPSRVVIAFGPKRLQELVNAFRADKKAGRPLVHCGKYEIADNPRFGVSAYSASICWVYLDRTEGWVGNLDQQNNRKLRQVVKQNFPHYRTFFAGGAEVVRLRPPDVNALSNLTAWTVLSEQTKIGTALGLSPRENGTCSPDRP